MITEQTQKAAAVIDAVRAVANRYPYLNEVGVFARYSDNPIIVVNIYHDEEKLLRLGDELGRDGWTAKQDDEDWNWSKEIMGVKINLNSVKKAPEPLVIPVIPKDWPVLLHDSNLSIV